MRFIRASVIVAILALCGAGSAWAQAVAGSQLSGVVRDTSGGTIPGAEVTATKTDTGQVRTVFTDGNGAYILPNLPIGPYQLKVVLQGFKTYTRDGIILQVSSNPEINVVLDVGALSEEVTVTANATLVETHSTGVGQVIDNQRVLEMPLNGRQATELIFLSGLATAAPAGDLNTNKNFPTVTISVAGGQANGISYIMDGGTHNDPFNNLNLPTPFPDALQEFKVETSALPARYGHHAASAVNLVTKSGSNKISGDLFDFWRNWRFNEKNYFAATRDSLNRQTYGGTIGAPIIKNKVFFFGGYQHKDEKSNPGTTISYVPTAAMLAGDFTTYGSAACQGTARTFTGGMVGNKIDPSKFSPVALNFLKHVPVSTDPCGKLTYGIPNDNTETQGLAKIDYTVDNNHSLAVRYFYAVYDNPDVYDGTNVLTLSRTGQNNLAHSTVGAYNWVVSSTTLNSIHFTFNRTLNDRSIPEYFSPADLGAKVYSPLAGFMGVSVTGNGFSVGAGGTNPGYFNSRSFQFADDLDLVRGNHQISAGFNIIKTSIETLNNRPTNGQFTFNGSGTGTGLTDFMLGVASGGFVQGNAVFDYDNHLYMGAYAQDNWKARPDLTINYGIRWEPYRAVQSTKSWISNFDMDRFRAGTKSTVYPQAPAGLYFPGDPGFPDNGAMQNKIANFAPRVGLIWSPGNDEKTSVRASWGVFYDTPHLFFNTRFANNPPWGAQVTLGSTSFDNPWATAVGGNPWPNLANNWQTAAFPFNGVYVNAPVNTEPTALQQWNISVQRQMGDWLTTISYLGNHSSHLWRATELNPAIFAAGATTGNTNARRTLVLQNPTQGAYYGTIGQLDDSGVANYNGLLLSLQRRLKNNLSVLSNWTISKCMSDPATTELTGPTIMDPNNPNADYSYCSSDRRHVFNLSMVYTLPQMKGVAGMLISDWQFSPIVRYQTGNRATITTGADNALSGMGGQRGVQILDNPYGDGTELNYLVRAAFTTPTAGTYSSLAPFSIVNPSNFQNDLSVSRTFKFPNKQTLQFRWEVFNVINHVNFNAPITALNSGSFGQIQSAGDPRIMQLALKFVF